MTSLEIFDSAAWPETAEGVARLWAEHTLRRAARQIGKIAALVALTGAVLGSASALVRSNGATELPVASGGSWIEVNRPIQLYGLAGTEFGRLPLVYRARRHSTGGGREDVLTFGDLQADEPYLELSLYRIGGEAVVSLSFADTLDRLGRRGVSLFHLGPSAILPTRFGTFETADVRLIDHQASTSCLGFRRTPIDGSILQISGLICGAAQKPTGRGALGCVIDRIDLVSAGEDAALRNVFVEAERRRGGECVPSPLTSAGAKTTWLAANGSLPPKGPLGPVGLRP